MVADKAENNFVGVFDSSLDNGLYEILNFGVVGYGLGDIELLLEEEILRFDPDYIILMFFNGNDFRDTYLGTDKYDLSNNLLVWNNAVLKSKLPDGVGELQQSAKVGNNQEATTPLNNIHLYRRFKQALAFLSESDQAKAMSDFLVINNFNWPTFWS